VPTGIDRILVPPRNPSKGVVSQSVAADNFFQRDSSELVVRFIETENIRKVRERKADPISAAVSVCFSHESLAVLSRFLVFS
jgi:hypothetical protein